MRKNHVAVGLALFVLAACATDDDSTSAPDAPATDEGRDPEAAPDDAGEQEPSTDVRELETIELPALDVPESDPDDAAIADAAARWDVAEETAAVRIRLQDSGAPIRHELQERYPDAFAHESVGPNGEQVYAFTEPLPEVEDAITQAYIDADIDLEHVTLKLADFTAEQIRERQAHAWDVVSRLADRFNIDHWGLGTDPDSGVSYVDLDEGHAEFEEAVRADLAHDVEFRTDGAPTEDLPEPQ